MYCINAMCTIFQFNIVTNLWHHERNTPESLMWNPKMTVDLWRVKASCRRNQVSIDLTSDEWTFLWLMIIPVWSILVATSATWLVMICYNIHELWIVIPIAIPTSFKLHLGSFPIRSRLPMSIYTVRNSAAEIPLWTSGWFSNFGWVSRHFG